MPYFMRIHGGVGMHAGFLPGYPVVIADEKMMRDFGSVEAVPTTFIMNRKGDIAGKHIGFTDRATLEKEIKPLL